jgi:hypothetical protein
VLDVDQRKFRHLRLQDVPPCEISTEFPVISDDEFSLQVIKHFSDVLEKESSDDLYYKVVKEVEKQQPALRSIPAPQLPADQWKAPGWQTSSWDAYTYHPQPDDQEAGEQPITPNTAILEEARAPVEAAPTQVPETTIFTASEASGQRQYKNKASEYTARWRKKNPQQHSQNNINWQRTPKGREYRKEYMRQWRARKKAERLAQQSPQ